MDATPLSLLGEAAALIAGYQTYHWFESRLYRRCAPTIRLEPRPLIGTIHRTHRCGVAVDPTHEFVPREIYDGDEPPF
jgi:hypothetical protein